MVSFLYSPHPIRSRNLRKRFKPPCAISPAMKASYTPNILVSTHIFRPINFVHLTYQIGVILHSPPTPTQGGSSLSILVMTTSQTNERSFQVSIWIIWSFNEREKLSLICLFFLVFIVGSFKVCCL